VHRSAIVAVALLASAPAAADVELHGFVEAAWGVRASESPVHASGSYTLEDVRAQLRASAVGAAGEAFARLDFLRDPLAEQREVLEVREAFGRFVTAGDRLEVKAGRQILTWGTGDLVFVNDLFPKDWESFFVGRDDQYLKAPSDALRLGVFGLPFDVDFVLTPRFTEDRLPVPGGRLSLPAPPAGAPAPETPPASLENAEVAARLSRWVGDLTLEAYGYHGFTKAPVGTRADTGAPFHPELDALGASGRGALLGGVGWAEYAYYRSAKPVAGGDAVPGSSHQYLGGWERAIVADLNVTVQYRGAALLDAGDDDLEHLVTARIEKLLRYQTVRLSLFGYHDPEDGDSYLRALGSWSISDDVNVALGANLFRGRADTQFGAFGDDDNVYLRVRTSF